jgi:hypothetical protein
LLDYIFQILHAIDNRIQPFTYNDQWFIEKKNGDKLNIIRDQNRQDMRSLSAAGIHPGDVLQVKPARLDWAQS